MLCFTYKTFRPQDSDGLRAKVLTSLDELTEYFEERFNSLRKKDAELSLIRKAKENKIICRDAESVCRRCDKQADRAGRYLSRIKY